MRKMIWVFFKEKLGKSAIFELLNCSWNETAFISHITFEPVKYKITIPRIPFKINPRDSLFISVHFERMPRSKYYKLKIKVDGIDCIYKVSE